MEGQFRMFDVLFDAGSLYELFCQGILFPIIDQRSHDISAEDIHSIGGYLSDILAELTGIFLQKKLRENLKISGPVP